MTDTQVAEIATSRRREATRQRLLDAAAEVFAEVGLDAASVEAICERAGFTRGAFYSNFATKDELFLELAGRVSRERVAVVTERVAELARDGVEITAQSALEMVQLVLGETGDDRLGILLMSEIRNHALRDPALAAAHLAQDDELRRSVAQIIADIGDAGGLSLRVPPEEAAGLMLTVWESATVRATMAGLDHEQVRGLTNAQLAGVAQLLIEPR
ncbi:TetR/AcrR family transcriptional regulator [Microbacterium ulmi]|uniref:TetR/AcrR family transcriptional regulator n=1 Tax=Microbacterium ulmi TaxID=179095 RepID=A0A7Y2M386_9MICO|nr:TetR/AcrR family transcriptional regulator [Microbacterium ulmi]NII68786.1 AcrR family transcriptional regulator [Microbacterium ulmi]NNH05387.1 TetR/AcrR family transcriptional regulator [Microbacterium ulmi]